MNDPYNQNAPRGFVRAYYDLEPELSDFANKRAKELALSKRAYVRFLIIQDKENSERGSKKKR